MGTKHEFLEIYWRYQRIRENWKPWTNNVLHGRDAVLGQDGVELAMDKIREEIIEKFGFNVGCSHGEICAFIDTLED